MKPLLFAVCVLSVATSLAIDAQSGSPPATAATRGYVPVTDEMLWKPDPANWLSWRRTLDGWGYSPLDQIDRNNVSRMKMMWTRGLGTGSVEATPLVYNGVMYVPGPGDVIAAIDAKTGDLVWEHRRKLPEGINGGTNRNIAIWGSTLIDGSADNQIYAVDVHTGNMVWETAVMEAKKRARSSAGPIIANGKVITGRQCQPDAGNDACIITAHDAQTGKEVWRTRTIPLPGEPGYETWGNVPMAERWHVGTWMVPSYDPELNRIFVGTSVTIPAPKFIAGGQRPDVSLPQLDAGHRCRHRQDRLALPARRRSLGPRSSLRAPARGNGDRARPERGRLDQPEDQAGRAPQGRHRHSRKDRHRLHARSRDRRVPVGAADDHAERDQGHRRRHRQGDRQSRRHVLEAG